MLSAARSLIFPSFLKKSTKSTKAHLQSQEYSFWLFLARLSDLYCGNSSKKRFLTSLNIKNFFFISKSFFACCLYYRNIRAKLAKSHPHFQTISSVRVRICVSHFTLRSVYRKCRTTRLQTIDSTTSLRCSCTACNLHSNKTSYPK